jgi:prepilin-type N-terminal cleavage/methylation domain-containing protein
VKGWLVYLGNHQQLLKRPAPLHQIRNAFTLTELLVIIAVMGVLAALILPAFSRSKETAIMTVCLNNLRPIGAGISMYSEDNDFRFPRGVRTATIDEPGENNWIALGETDASVTMANVVPKAKNR